MLMSRDYSVAARRQGLNWSCLNSYCPKGNPNLPFTREFQYHIVFDAHLTVRRLRKMSTDWKWNAPARRVFRIAAGFLGVGCLATGALLLYDHYQSASPFMFDSSARAEIAMLFWGVLFLLVAIRGRIVKRDIG